MSVEAAGPGRIGRTHAPDLKGVRCQGCGTATGGAAVCVRCGTPAGVRPARPRLPGLLRGLGAPFRGMGYLALHPRLWGWVIVPLIINTAFFVLAVIFCVNTLGDWLPDLSQPWPAWLEWARIGADWLLQTLLYSVGILAAFIATLLLAGIVNSPFYDLLSEKVESLYFGGKDPGRPWTALPMDLLRSMGAALSLVIRQALVLTPLFLLSFTAIGAPLFALAGFYYAGLGLVDVTLARKLYPGMRRARWGWRHAGLLLGAGVPLSLLPLLAPFGIVGMTLEFLGEPDKG